MYISAADDRRAFSFWLRTGHLPRARTPDGVELKFNPWHDPFNGRFTFAPGGAARSRVTGYSRGTPRDASVIAPTAAARGRPPARMQPLYGKGSNSQPFERAMTIEQVFPGLGNAPAGAILAVADNLLDLRGPAAEAQAALIDNWSQKIFSEIKTIDPAWRYDRLGPINTIDGKINELNMLRFHRAAVFLRVKGDPRPLQLETLRFVQSTADLSYEQGIARLEAGHMKVRLSDREALGNYIDREVRRALRQQYNQFDIDAAGKGSVRVNRRENDSSGTDLTYRRPDARVSDIAFDVTLTRKTLATAQVRGFFNTDFRPQRVVIIRPRQLGAEATYIITRPEQKR